MKILYLLIISFILASCTTFESNKEYTLNDSVPHTLKWTLVDTLYDSIPYFSSHHDFDTVTIGDTLKWYQVDHTKNFLYYLLIIDDSLQEHSIYPRSGERTKNTYSVINDLKRPSSIIYCHIVAFLVLYDNNTYAPKVFQKSSFKDLILFYKSP